MDHPMPMQDVAGFHIEVNFIEEHGMNDNHHKLLDCIWTIKKPRLMNMQMYFAGPMSLMSKCNGYLVMIRP
jgi:hypothetical protein